MSPRSLLIPAALLAAVLCLAPWTASASAQTEVTVFVPREETDTATGLRQKAQEQGFAQAVADTAAELSPCPLDETRRASLAALFGPRAGRYVQGYTELSSRHTPEGFELSLGVEVNRRQLRDDLAGLGLAATCNRPLAIGLAPGAGLTPEDTAALTDMVRLTGMTPTPGARPELLVSRVSADLLRGELHSDAGAWAANAADMGGLWLALWPRYFAQSRPTAAASGGGVLLTVSGWFVPDGALEFDREISGWDALVARAQLLDLQMRSEGVTAHWDLAVRDPAGLKARLEDYLAGRGLTYTLGSAPASGPAPAAGIPSVPSGPGVTP